MSLLRSPKRTPVPTAEGEEAGAERSRGYGATAGSGEPTQRSQSFSESFSEAASEAWHKRVFPNLPKTVDTLICCLGLSLTLISLLTVEKLTGFRLYSLSMSASGIIFFAPQAPPQLNGFLVGTASAATVSWALFTCLPFEVACGLAAGVVLFFYKSFNVIFPPACVLGVLISQETSVSVWRMPALEMVKVSCADCEATCQREESILSLHDWWKTALFVLSPWLSGHAILYLAAMALSEFRKVTRRHMLRGQLAGLGGFFSCKPCLCVHFELHTCTQERSSEAPETCKEPRDTPHGRSYLRTSTPATHPRTHARTLTRAPP